MKNNNNKGFTLIELLVVIAIIGILSAIAMINLNSARDKAKNAGAQGSLSAALPIAVLCLDGQQNLSWGGAVASTAKAGNQICASKSITSGSWPVLNTYGWRYTKGSPSPVSDYTNNVFNYAAFKSGNATIKVTCSLSGCAKSGW